MTSTLFLHQQPSSHTVLIHSLHVCKPTQYSLILSTRQLTFYSSSYRHLFIPNYPFVTLPPNFSNTSSQEHSLSFSRHFSCPTLLLRITPLVQSLLHIYTSSHLSPILYCIAYFQRSSSRIIPHSLVYHIPLISSTWCHLRSQVFQTINFL